MSVGSVSKISVILLIVGLAVGGGGGYVLSSNLMQSRIDEYETEISDLMSEVSSLNSTVSDLEAEKSDYETQLSNLEDQISSYNAQITGLEAQVLALGVQISSLEDEVSDLESELSYGQNMISDYEDQIAYLQSQVSSLQDVLESYVPDTFTIGMAASSLQSLEKVQTVATIATNDINEHCLIEGVPFTFEFKVLCNYDDPDEAVENTIFFNSIGVNLIVGQETNRETSLSLQYVNTHEMLMISPSATAQELAKTSDNLYRTCPTYLAQTIVMAESLVNWGANAVIVIQRGDEWADGIYSAFLNEYEKRGGVIYKRIRYDAGTTNFGGHMNQAEAAALEAVNEYGGNNVAIVLISLDEADNIIDFAKYYNTLYSLYWFGSESTAKNLNLFKNIPQQVNKLKVFSPLVTQEENDMYEKFAEDYSSIMGKVPDFYTSAMYDACWLYALSIVKTWTAEISYVKQELPSIAENFYGASGWLRLNEEGDRYAVDYEIWGYGLDDGALVNVIYGYYDAKDGEVTWFEDTGISPPG
ncbi:MAG: ABC transporter substrate-binding protein [Candidatus Bathyarchaeota archaeon]|nr:ABC transporter substrate-binding protein [Candidatus Bathyarchaeota archaeon]